MDSNHGHSKVLPGMNRETNRLLYHWAIPRTYITVNFCYYILLIVYSVIHTVSIYWLLYCQYFNNWQPPHHTFSITDKLVSLYQGDLEWVLTKMFALKSCVAVILAFALDSVVIILVTRDDKYCQYLNIVNKHWLCEVSLVTSFMTLSCVPSDRVTHQLCQAEWQVALHS